MMGIIDRRTATFAVHDEEGGAMGIFSMLRHDESARSTAREAMSAAEE